MAALRYALITPSYEPDFERCELLARTAAQFCAPGMTHHVIVEKRDLQLFSRLKGPRTELHTVQSFIPGWLFRPPFSRRLGWLSLKGRPVRNWIMQQLVKLSVAERVDADVLVYADSDVFFIRPFDPSQLARDGRVPLFREEKPENVSEANHAWHQTAARCLGLPLLPRYETNYIAQLVQWRRDNVLALHRHLERLHGRSWVETLCRLETLAEYVLYGMFAEHVLKDDAGHYFSSDIACWHYWKTQTLTAPELKTLFARVKPEQVAMMVSAKARIGVKTILEALG